MRSDPKRQALMNQYIAEKGEPWNACYCNNCDDGSYVKWLETNLLSGNDTFRADVREMIQFMDSYGFRNQQMLDFIDKVRAHLEGEVKK